MAKSGPRPPRSSAGEHSQSADTRAALIEAAEAALREVGFARATARAIARRAGCNQALVFYHFGSVTNLLLAALDEVTPSGGDATTWLRSRARVAERAGGARRPHIFSEDLDAGHVAVLVEMITGAQSTPGWASRSRPGWRRGRSSPRPPSGARSPAPAALAGARREIAHAVVALTSAWSCWPPRRERRCRARAVRPGGALAGLADPDRKPRAVDTDGRHPDGSST